MEREGGRVGTRIETKGKFYCCVSVKFLKLVGVEPQMSELMQYVLVHHMGKSLVPATRN